MDWRYNTLWREQLPEAELAVVNFQNAAAATAGLPGRRYVFATRFRSKFENLTDLPADDDIEYLYLGSANIRNFIGLSRFKRLKRLEVEGCRQLSSDLGLSGVGDSIEWLNIDGARKFSPGDELPRLRHLRVLCLNGCGPIENLDFLRLLPKLLDFRFVDSSVVSGDLSPLLAHPALCSAGFLNKRHYSLKDSQVDAQLRPKWPSAIETLHKGPYETYRYLDLGT